MGSNPIPSILVLDTSPLQGLFRGDALELLESACQEVQIPQAVDIETRKSHGNPEIAAKVPDLNRYPWIRVSPVSDDELIEAGGRYVGLHRGTQTFQWLGQEIQRPEFEALVLAKARDVDLVIEDRVALRCARDLGIRVLTTARLLSLLQQAEYIHDASSRARKILCTGYHQDDLELLAGEGRSPLSQRRAEEGCDPRVIEPKWQGRWEQARLFRAGERAGARKKYVLEMFPYPSGNMHMGHVRNYLIGDVLARYYRMCGFDVLHPFGWDALGLPAENAAIKDQRHPAERTAENITTFRADVVALGLSYDWDREVNTSAPSYYRWNQWFFIKMLEKGIVYRRRSQVNWCPGCATVIANEQVKHDGTCERSGDVVERRDMPEWTFRITAYAQGLLEGIDTLQGWPDRITNMQRQWIGKSEGAEVDFKLKDVPGQIRIFTTRLDTIFGCTYVMVAPEHPVVDRIVRPEARPLVRALVAERTEPKGVDTGAMAIHPYTNEEIPVWVSSFVVASHGTGAVMSVPAHDPRDLEFARRYGLAIRPVIVPTGKTERSDGGQAERAFTEDGVLVNSGAFTGMSSREARRALADEAVKKGFGEGRVNWHLRDWGFSRQRYWGTPIPIVYCERCDPLERGIPVPEAQLPVELPDIDVQRVLTGRGEPPLAKVPEWVNTKCPRCSGPARREVETMDTFVDSAWYYARYLSPTCDRQPFDPAEAGRWLPVDVYVGGPEHAVRHLLYFRFWTRVMQDLGLVSVDEPVKRLVIQGMVKKDGKKMSKRGGNVVSPADLIREHGADALRMGVMFAAPPEDDIEWDDGQVDGCSRFLLQVWKLARAHAGASGRAFEGPVEADALAIRRISHKCLQGVTQRIEKLALNTAIAEMMKTVNELKRLEASSGPNVEAAWNEAMRILAACLSPFAPHLADELGELYGVTSSFQAQEWPAFDPALTADDTLFYAVQVNGTILGEVQVPAGADEVQVTAMAKDLLAIEPRFAATDIKKVIFVPNRLVNFVL